MAGLMKVPACRGMTGLFFGPEFEFPRRRAEREAECRTICEACPVIVECRTRARQRREHGFWGGESELDRARLGRGPVETTRRALRGYGSRVRADPDPDDPIVKAYRKARERRAG